MTCDISRLDELEDDDEILDFLKSVDEEATSRYHALHTEWERNLLFYLGRQWLQKKSGTYDGYDILDDVEGHYRPVTNHTARLCDLKRSQVLGKTVRAKLEPASTQRDDVAAARLGSLMLRALNQIDDEDAHNQVAFLHAQIFGICWRSDYKQVSPTENMEEPEFGDVEFAEATCACGYKTQTDVNDMMPMCPQCNAVMDKKISTRQEQLTDDEGNPRVKRTPVYQNAVAVVDPFRIKVNACATQKDMRYLGDSSIQPVSWVKRAYSVEGEGFKGNTENVKKAKSLPRGLKISEEFKNSVSYSHSTLNKDVYKGSLVDNEDDTTVLHKYYFAPSEKFPRGRLIIWTPDAVLYDGKPDLPSTTKIKAWHPYNIFVYRRHPLRLEGIPYIEDLIPLNKKYNSLTAMILEHIDKTAEPDRVEFNNVTKNNDDQSSGVIVIEPVPGLAGGGIPTYLQHPQMASEVYNLLPATVAELEKVGNVTEILQGMRPSGVDTYRGLQLLRDSADSSEKELYARWYEFVRKCSQLKLAIVQDCLVGKNEELIEMMNVIRTNENYGVEEVEIFYGEDLRDNLNVVIEEVDYMAQSTAAQTDKVADFLKSMILTPEDLQDPVVKIQLMRKLGMSQMPMSDKADIEKAERVIEYLEAANVQQAMGILSIRDNKSLQLRVWSEWMKSSRYESLDPQIKQMSEMLVKRVEDELLRAQMQMKAQGPGGPPPGAGSGPGGPPPAPPPGPGGPPGDMAIQ